MVLTGIGDYAYKRPDDGVLVVPIGCLKNWDKKQTKIETKKIGDKSSILSPIAEFQTQNPFRKPSDSNLRGPVIKLHNLNNALFLVRYIKNIALFLVHI